MNNNDLTHINEGGSHSQNPLGGVPMGNGNSVEQGETKQNNFIYSDRIILNKDIIGQYGLPKSLIGKTVAEATKVIDSKFKDRSDKISESTKNKMLSKIAQAQEAMKPQELPQETTNNQMFLGGNMNSGEGMNSNTSAILGGLGAIGKALPNNMNTSNTPMSEEELRKANAWEGAKDAAGNIPVIGMFAQAGRAVEKMGKGIGQSIGGDKGGDIAKGFLDPISNVISKDTNFGEKALSIMDPVVSGIITAKKNKEKRDEAHYKQNVAMQSQFNNDFAYGGKMYAKGGILDTLGPVPLADDFITPTNLVDIKKYQLSKGLIPDGIVGPKTKAQFELDKRNWTPEIPDTSMLKSTNQPFVEPTGVQAEMEAYYQKNYPQNNKQYPKVNLSKIGDTLGQAARYAPIGMNAYQLSQLKKPGYSRLNRLDARFKPEYVDERSLQNIVGNEYDNTVNAITQMGGSEGATRNAILGAGLNKTKALGEAYMNAAGQNRQTNITGQQFNLGIDQANMGQANQELDINDRNSANYDTQKSKLQSQLGSDIGEVGKEQVYKDIVKKTFGYTYDGKYWIKPDGTKITNDEVKKELEIKNSQKKLGGFLLKK